MKETDFLKMKELGKQLLETAEKGIKEADQRKREGILSILFKEKLLINASESYNYGTWRLISWNLISVNLTNSTPLRKKVIDRIFELYPYSEAKIHINKLYPDACLLKFIIGDEKISAEIAIDYISRLGTIQIRFKNFEDLIELNKSGLFNVNWADFLNQEFNGIDAKENRIKAIQKEVKQETEYINHSYDVIRKVQDSTTAAQRGEYEFKMPNDLNLQYRIQEWLYNKLGIQGRTWRSVQRGTWPSAEFILFIGKDTFNQLKNEFLKKSWIWPEIIYQLPKEE